MTLWLAGQIPLATETELPSGERVALEADQLLYEPAKETLVARGHTTLRTERLVLRADELIYDQANQQAYAKGNVMLVSGLLAAVADEIRLDIRSYEAHVGGGLFLRKKNVTPEQLLQARTPQELKNIGETVLTLTGSRIKRVGPNEFQVDDLSFTPCDCDPTEPSWRVEARRADVALGERAILAFPTVYVYQVPIFWLPWLYLPLSDRRTGLLIPRPNFSALNGFSLEQPVFVTLGESYDATFTPGYYAGGRDRSFGIAGGRLHTEFRYAPSPRSSGRATVGLLYDRRNRRDPVEPGLCIPDPVDPGSCIIKGRRGLRGEASWQHVQDLGNGWRDRIDAGFVSDGYYLRDVTADVLARQAEYLRSTAVLYRGDELGWLGMDAVFRQQIWADSQKLGFDIFRQNRLASGDLVGAPRTIQRFPAVTYAIPERPLAGPLWGGVSAEYARHAPLAASFGDEGEDGVFRASQVRPTDPATYEPTQGDGRFERGEREARDRFDLNPRASLPFGLGRFARFTPYVGGRETVYYGELTGSMAHRGYFLAGASASTTLVREFRNGSVRHAITPYLEARAVPWTFGSVPGGSTRAYDEVDLAVPSDGFFQGVAEIRQELGVRRGGAYRDLLRLDVGQGFDLRSWRVADTYLRTSFHEGWLGLSGVVRYDVPRRLFSQVSATLSVDDRRGNGLAVSYDRLLDLGSDPLRAGIDELVGRPLSLVLPAGAPFGRAEQIGGGIRAAFPFGLGARYEAVVQPAAAQKIVQQLIGLSYGPGCNCWRLEVHAWLRPASATGGVLGSGLTADFGASLTLQQFGAIGAGG
jgi:LPS-assembly protein